MPSAADRHHRADLLGQLAEVVVLDRPPRRVRERERRERHPVTAERLVQPEPVEHPAAQWVRHQRVPVGAEGRVAVDDLDRAALASQQRGQGQAGDARADDPDAHLDG
jgi:hypothetical protein